ncbi:MAG: hypothetical protein WC683_01785 [bacterium]
MSGGHFGDTPYYLIADEIEQVIAENDSTEVNRYGDHKGRHYPAEVLARFREGVACLRCAHVFVRRIDYLLSSDDGPEQFLERLKEDLDVVLRGTVSEVLGDLSAKINDGRYSDEHIGRLVRAALAGKDRP